MDPLPQRGEESPEGGSTVGKRYRGIVEMAACTTFSSFEGIPGRMTLL